MLVKKEKLLKEVAFAFAQLVSYIDLINVVNFYDVNHILEDVFGQIFEVLYGCTFINLNLSKGCNFPAIDLGAEDGGLCIQVTSNSRRSKIKDTIKKFEKNKLYQDYKELQILMLVTKKDGLREAIATNKKYKFSKDESIVDLSGLYKKIASLDLKKLSLIHEVVIDNISPLESKLPKYSVETLIFRDLFLILSDEKEMVLNYPKKKIEESDLMIKKKRFSKYWNFIKDRYEKVFDSEREKEYLNIASTFSEDKQRVVSEYLQLESDKCLYRSKGDPVKAIDLLTQQIVNKFDIDFFPETEIKYFLYYQLFYCDVFPN